MSSEPRTTKTPTLWLLTLLALTCAVGASWSVGSAMGVVARAATLYDVPLPWWSHALALLFACSGAFGTILFAERGWDIRFRAVEWAALALVFAARFLWMGAGGPTAGAATAGLLAAAVPTLQALAAWWVGERMVRFALPVAEVEEGAQGDEEMREPVTADQNESSSQAHADVVTEAPPTPVREAYVAGRDFWLMVIGASALSWAIASFVAPAEGGMQVIAYAGALLHFGAGALYVAVLHQRSVHESFVLQEVRVADGFSPRVPRRVVWLIGALVALALLLPANLSPLHIRDFNNWMVALTDNFLGPLLVPSHAPGQRVGEELRRFSADAPWGFARTGPGGPDSLFNVVLRVAFLLLLVYVFWRIFASKRNADGTRGGMGPLSAGLRWLYEQIKGMLLELLARLGLVWGERKYLGGARIGGARTDTYGTRGGRPLLGSVAALYCHVLERFGRRGLARRPAETPHEFLTRWRGAAPATDERGLPVLTELYIEARYAERDEAAGTLKAARKAASLALRGWTRAALTSKLFGWLRRS